MQLDWDVNATRANDETEFRSPIPLITRSTYSHIPNCAERWRFPFLYCPIFSTQSVVRDGSLALLTEALDAQADNVAST